jgi:release factor glutamine methyltransferase
MLTVQNGITNLTRYFETNGIDGAAREARLLLAHLMKVDPGRMTLLAQDPLDPDLLEMALAQGSRRANGREPLSHILGYREFWGRRFHVDGRVLDPRPETEMLVAAALEAPYSEVLDLGTGSGCIVLTLLAERPYAVGIAVDVSERALAVAEENAKTIGVSGRVEFMKSHWFNAVGGRFDLIVSNPPYIAASEMAGLAPEVRDHEPHVALTPGGDGLDAYRAITAGAPMHLIPGGRLIVEIGPSQASAVSAMFTAVGLTQVAVTRDLDGRDRVISGQISC